MTTINDDLRAAIAAAPLHKLPTVHQAIYAALGDDQITQEQAETLEAALTARRTVASVTQPAQRHRGGSRPRSDASMARRRRWAAAGRLPPRIAAHYTLAEQAVLAFVAAETARRGDCRICHGHVAAVVGLARSTVRAALARARALGHVTIQERRVAAYKNDPSIVRIVSSEWLSWLRLGRREDRSTGAISAAPTTTNLGEGRPNRPSGSARMATEPETRRSRSAIRDAA